MANSTTRSVAQISHVPVGRLDGLLEYKGEIPTADLPGETPARLNDRVFALEERVRSLEMRLEAKEKENSVLLHRLAELEDWVAQLADNEFKQTVPNNSQPAKNYKVEYPYGINGNLVRVLLGAMKKYFFNGTNHVHPTALAFITVWNNSDEGMSNKTIRVGQGRAGVKLIHPSEFLNLDGGFIKESEVWRNFRFIVQLLIELRENGKITTIRIEGHQIEASLVSLLADFSRGTRWAEFMRYLPQEDGYNITLDLH